MAKISSKHQSVPVHPGSRIAELRKARSITQVDLATRLGVNQPFVSKLERGELRAHGAVIVQIAQILGVSTDDLLGARTAAAQVPTPILRDRRLRRRLHQIDQLSKRDREAILRTIDAFLAKRHDAA